MPAALGAQRASTLPDLVEAVLDVAEVCAVAGGVGPDGTVHLEWASARLTRDFGYTVDELTALGGPLAIVHPDDLSDAKAMVDGWANGELPRFEVRVVTKDGRTPWVRFRCEDEPDPDRPGHLRFLGVLQDVTAEVESRRASAATAARLHAFFEHSPVAQVIVSTDKRFLGVNPAFCELTGYAEDELLGRHPSMVVDPTVLEEAEARFDRNAESAAHRLDHESQWLTKDGRVIDVAVTVVPERDHEGRIRQFITSAQDITARHRAQEAVERLAAIVQGSEDAILSLTLDGTVTSWNASAERIYGYTPEEMIGSSLAPIVPTDRWAELLHLLDVVAAGGRVAGHVTERVRKDGEILDVAVSVSPIHDRYGAVSGASVTARDITAAKRYQDALMAAAEQRRTLLARLVDTQHEERVRLARELHDGLGQTLTSAALFAKSLEQEADGELGAAVGSLRALLDEGLAETRTLVWRLRPVEVEELGFSAALKTIAEKFRQRHGVPVEVHLRGMDDLPPVLEAAAYRIVQEALTNAVKHAAPKNLSVVATRLADTLTIIVEDDGEGFDPEVVQAGWRGGGAGILGMKERAGELGGQLVVESRAGSGTTVRLVVPCSPGEGA
jgi:two-component system sensor histidine kinase UhpB